MDRRIYVQMAPDKAARRELMRIGEALPAQKSGRLLPESELHVTLIHFGKARDVLAAMRRVVEVDDDEYADNLQEYVRKTRTLLTDAVYPLAALGYGRFGARRTTLVARYEASAELHEIHANAYNELLRFLGSCGIADAAGFAGDDPNFMFAATFNPHITLYKGYDGPDPREPLPTVSARFMKLEYEP